MILFMLVPVAWMLAWVLLRIVLVERLRAARRRGTVIDGRWRDLDETGPVEATEAGPPCGREGLHRFLRLFAAEDGCKHCAAAVRARQESEQRAAIDEAERQIARDRKE